MRNVFSRSLGAGWFAGFWRHWNLVWGYALGSYVYAPLRRFVPPGPAAAANPKTNKARTLEGSGLADVTKTSHGGGGSVWVQDIGNGVCRVIGNAWW